jgi:hypothetical protein
MADVDWLVQGRRSATPIITAPGVEADGAAQRLDAVLAGSSGEMPGWFKAVEKLGYWWYLLGVVVVVPIVVLVAPAEMWQRITSGIAGGVLLAILSSAIITSVARAQARSKAAADARSGGDLKQQARVAPLKARETVDAIVGRNARLEGQVHTLLWRSALSATPDGAAAQKELDALLVTVAPETATEHATGELALEPQLDQIRKRNGL